jgi:type II secretory pathway pseudopilin PulG
MFARRNKSAFTLIEVLAAVGAFTIAFLAGFAAIGTFMIKQDAAYQRTIAATAAMLLADQHLRYTGSLTAAQAALPASGSMTQRAIAGANPLLVAASPTATITKRGGDFVTGDKYFVFAAGTITDPTLNSAQFDLSEYQALVITTSATVADTAGVYQTQANFWYGSRDDILSNKATTIEFLGRYLLPDMMVP